MLSSITLSLTAHFNRAHPEDRHALHALDDQQKREVEAQTRTQKQQQSIVTSRGKIDITIR